jgi:microcystin-dependent protein
MANYTQLTNFATKDNLASGNANKIVKGVEINAEFVAIGTAVNSKADIASPTFTGTPAAPTAGSSTNTTQLATTAFVQTAVGALVTIPSGMLAPFAGATAPTGWFLCYGQEVSRTDYANLFTAVGTVYGNGDGSTTFNLPDLRGRTIAGQDDMGGAAASRLTGDNGATTATASANGSFTSTTNILVDGNSGTIVLGMKVTGTGISGEVTVVKINSQTDIVLSSAVTITNDTALTFAFDGSILGSAGGENTHLLTGAESGEKGHQHTLTENPHSHPITTSPGQASDGTLNRVRSATEGQGTATHSTNPASTNITIDAIAAADASSAHNIIQPTLVLNYIIKQ